MSIMTKSPTPPPRTANREFTSKQKAQALVKLLDAKEKIEMALMFVPNVSNRSGVNASIKEAIRNICEDIISQEVA